MITPTILPKNVTEASSPLVYSSSPLSSLRLDGIISSLILDIPPFDIPLLTGNQSNGLARFNITSVGKFILAGHWNMTFNNITSVDGKNSALEVQGFEADFIAVFEDGSGAHRHQITNFQPRRVNSSQGPEEDPKSRIYSNILTPEGNGHIVGTVDVGINSQKIWEGVNANITLLGGRTIEIMLDERDVDYHFGKGQSIYGLVNITTLSKSSK
ncbi:MAG: hypothetical protein M3298_01790 [Thermoproteota archaeon]|nr:hypothetical protein [Thermoproteota archaeon]